LQWQRAFFVTRFFVCIDEQRLRARLQTSSKHATLDFSRRTLETVQLFVLWSSALKGGRFWVTVIYFWCDRTVIPTNTKYSNQYKPGSKKSSARMDMVPKFSRVAVVASWHVLSAYLAVTHFSTTEKDCFSTATKIRLIHRK
jgi:hypothetical protein